MTWKWSGSGVEVEWKSCAQILESEDGPESRLESPTQGTRSVPHTLRSTGRTPSLARCGRTIREERRKVTMAHEIGTGPVLVGVNTLTINAETMKVILTDWLCTNVSGGPYSVTDVDIDANSDFALTITANEKPKPKQ